MSGIRSIGWWIPAERRSVQQLARRFGVAEGALKRLGLESVAVAGPEDHPSTMGARATRLALEAAGLSVDDVDLLIFAGITKDYSEPWVAALGVLHELRSKRAAGFDIASRCASVIDALWLAKALIDAGRHKTIVVCCAERFDKSPGPEPGSFDRVADALYSAGAAAAVVTCDAANSIAAFSSFTSPDLSVHAGMVPAAGGTRLPLDERAINAGQHFWQSRLSMRQVQDIANYSAQADLHNYPSIFRQAGIDGVDFIACSPFYVEPQFEVLRSLDIDPCATLFTIPHLGHIGPADLLLILGIAIASGRRVGTRTVMSTRTIVYSNALGILSSAPTAGIAVAGQGVDLKLWS